MKIIEEQIKESQERKQKEKMQIEQENKEIREQFKKDKEVALMYNLLLDWTRNYSSFEGSI